ncbi:hypothetical protein FIBSPDRAFT_554340 [Athelia psychrophila]|uniref:Uncharacterized protein n=1 Tax=Athelia psychrophila TaxID=1759441 RepID=A0A166IMK7_9AGAM|nr:hypothetical protein FIBSPDRAFT_554340 [Fibularhizoctonia sp. CBS 109695]
MQSHAVQWPLLRKTRPSEFSDQIDFRVSSGFIESRCSDGYRGPPPRTPPRTPRTSQNPSKSWSGGRGGGGGGFTPTFPQPPTQREWRISTAWDVCRQVGVLPSPEFGVHRVSAKDAGLLGRRFFGLMILILEGPSGSHTLPVGQRQLEFGNRKSSRIASDIPKVSACSSSFHHAFFNLLGRHRLVLGPRHFFIHHPSFVRPKLDYVSLIGI